jgi:hypothetical protein
MRRSRTYPITPGVVPDSNVGYSESTDDDSSGIPLQHQLRSPNNSSADLEVYPLDLNLPSHHGYHPTYPTAIVPIIAAATTTTTDASSTYATAALVHNIASFLTLSDAVSLASFGGGLGTAVTTTTIMTPADSWAVGVELESDLNSWSFGNIGTPLTPALVTISPGATPNHDGGYLEDNLNEEGHAEEAGDEILIRREINSFSDFGRMEELLQERRRRWAQEKITVAVFSHPRSLRSFCWEAYIAAKDIQVQKELAAIYVSNEEETPETQVEPPGLVLNRKRKRPVKPMDLRSMIVHEVVDWIFRSVPISVLLDVLEATGVTVFDTAGASFKITIRSLQHAIAALGNLVCTVWDTVTHCVTNPFQVLEAIVSLQFNAMGKTSEVLVSGIQSVATGVGSASNMALYRLSATANMSSSASLAGHIIPGDGKSGTFNKRLLQKLSTMNSAGLVVKYRESEDDACGLTRHAVSRTRRMMHYSVSLRPFVATVKIRPNSAQRRGYGDYDQGLDSPIESVEDLQRMDSFSSSSLEDGQNSPFMCTPQSFPPTPHSRQMVIAQRSQLSDDVVFLARDRLRVHDGLASDDVRTRELSQALEDGKRLAIFACDKDSGIELTCGKHIATKNGGMYYASARSMVAVLRNCYVYFEFTVLPRLLTPTLATLAIGLSTEEMPPNTLVGAWQSSVGLCTTGQILIAGQWCSPADPAKFAYGVGSTVGCLVCLDDDKAFETWDGVMIKASIRLTVNGVMVSPPVSTLPMSGAPGSLPISPSTLSVGSSAGRSNVIGSVGSGERVSPSPLSPSRRLELPSSTLTLLVPSAEDLYPTLTLQSPATSVVCRFSSEDVMASDREMIGAPPGVVVYAIDGSVILNDFEDSSSQ